ADRSLGAPARRPDGTAAGACEEHRHQPASLEQIDHEQRGAAAEPRAVGRGLDLRQLELAGRLGGGDGRQGPAQPRAAAIFSAARVASAMIVTCGFTPSEVGTAEPSTTYRPGVSWTW